jgi:uncharacterized membrane protein YkoI
MKSSHIIALLAALAVPHFAFAEEEEDKPVKFDELPAPVAKAIKEAAGGAKLGKITLGDEDGTPAYETTWTAGGHQHEIAVDKKGAVLSLEEIITLAEAPAAVGAAIQKEAGDGKVSEVEKVLEKGRTVYEATIKKGKSKTVITFSESGKVVGHEEAEQDEKGEKGEKEGKKEKP